MRDALGVLAAFLLFSTLGSAQAQEWEVKPKLEGKADKDKPGKFKKSVDVSGIACNSETGLPRQCVVIDDEAQRAQVVIVDEGKIVAGQAIQLISDSFNGKPVELDGEGVAYDDGYFYVIGSHGSPRKTDKMPEAERQARMTANGQLLRFRIDKGDITKDGRLKETPRVEATSKLRQALKNVSQFGDKAESKLNENGLTIEGVAVRDGILYAGLRAPSDDGNASIATVTVDKLFDGEPEVPALVPHTITVGKGNGVRDLVRYKDAFIVLVGPSGDLEEDDPGKYFVVRWPGHGDVVGPRTDVEALPGKPGDKAKFIKPEAIVVLDENSDGVRLLVLNDGATEGRPRSITMR